MIKEEMMAKIASDTMISRGIVEDVVNTRIPLEWTREDVYE